MSDVEYEKAKTFITRDTIEYVAHSVIIKTILKKPTGHVALSSFDYDEILSEKPLPFDNLIQVIEGGAEITIDKVSHLVDTGQAIIIPAHAVHSIRAKGRLKMISTVIKSGYEEYML